MTGLKKLMGFITHRVFVVAFLIVLEVAFIISMVWKFNIDYFVYFYIGSYLLGILMSIFIINGKTNPGYKIAWIMVILMLPVIGLLFYLLVSGDQLSKREKKKLQEIYDHQIKNISQDEKVMELLKNDSLSAYNQAKYITKYSLSPVCQNTEYEYFKVGEEYYKRLLEELKNAKRYIFLEYFIVEEGKMWDSILEVLKRALKFE